MAFYGILHYFPKWNVVKSQSLEECLLKRSFLIVPELQRRVDRLDLKKHGAFKGEVHEFERTKTASLAHTLGRWFFILFKRSIVRTYQMHSSQTGQ